MPEFDPTAKNRWRGEAPRAQDLADGADVEWSGHCNGTLVHTFSSLRRRSAMEIFVRRGTEADAEAAIDTIRRSISELCVADYQDDPQRLSSWLCNKTDATWIVWIERHNAVVLVAEMAGRIAGVGMVDHFGNILLNYVHPESRFCGVSKAILTALENKARAHGAQRCLLESTKTARAFYERCGYLPLDGSATHLWRPI